MTVRELTADDATWAAGLMEQRRQVYARYSPVFWRPAQGVTGLHTRFLRRQIASPANVALRTDNGFIVGQRRAGEGFVDDFAVDAEGSWDTDGAELLRAIWQRLAAEGGFGALRVVTAHADEDKSRMLARLSLELADQWWVRKLRPAPQPGPAPGPLASQPHSASQPGPVRPPRPATRVDGAGFSGILGPAPPVYDPGGPVLLVEHLAEDADLAAIEAETAGLGAVLLIVPAAPGQPPAGLDRPGWSVASDWYLGQPAAT